MAVPTAQKLPETLYAAPSRALQAGEVLKTEDVELVAWPGSDPVDGAFTQPAQAIGREALFPLGKGQPLLDADLSTAGSAPALRAGFRTACGRLRCAPMKWLESPDFWFPDRIWTCW